MELTEAWGEDAPSSVAPTHSAVSARVATTPPAPSEPEDRIVRALLDELALLRREQSRRGSIFMIVVCVLFASVLNYLDRLHAQMRRLSEGGALPYLAR